ncbi:hypothetical protein WICMUC_001460 [Wickerhamomyces mucosus]|uniref:Uncharacterized protein n=1 Tax=Wickerhamomyces mucosus TaxID=1378264 RepID=A0A9P8PU79_9ASCO|nr:hypothetical protein WICMUC_001460 [Wickerhamomyces mucosus]
MTNIYLKSRVNNSGQYKTPCQIKPYYTSSNLSISIPDTDAELGPASKFPKIKTKASTNRVFCIRAMIGIGFILSIVALIPIIIYAFPQMIWNVVYFISLLISSTFFSTGAIFLIKWIKYRFFKNYQLSKLINDILENTFLNNHTSFHYIQNSYMGPTIKSFNYRKLVDSDSEDQIFFTNHHTDDYYEELGIKEQDRLSWGIGQIFISIILILLGRYGINESIELFSEINSHIFNQQQLLNSVLQFSLSVVSIIIGSLK